MTRKRRQREESPAHPGVPSADEAASAAIRASIELARRDLSTFGWMRTRPERADRLIENLERVGYAGYRYDDEWVAVDFCPASPRTSDAALSAALPSSRAVMEAVLAEAVRQAGADARTYGHVFVKAWQEGLLDRTLPTGYQYHVEHTSESSTLTVRIEY